MPSPDTCRPTPAQTRWMALRYGMFIHFGINTFSRTMWGDGTFPAEAFCPRKLDTDQWVQMAMDAGMRYVVLTAKHHDGFCLWPSEHTRYGVVAGRPPMDVVGKLAESCRRHGLAMGLYYSLWDRNAPCYLDDAAYAAYVRAQIGELLQWYGPVVELWFDGAWDKDHPNRQPQYDPAWEQSADSGLQYGQRWQWDQLYAYIKSLQPACLVINNSSCERPGRVKYLPVDVRTAELFDFVYQGQLYTPITNCRYRSADGAEIFIPLEFCATLNRNWFYDPHQGQSHPSAATIADWFNRAAAADANLLVNIGPNDLGLLPEYHRAFLRDARQYFGK